MTIINPLIDVKFDTDPTGKYKDLKIAMETLAGSLCTDIYEHGLAGMGVHLTCTEFAEKNTDQERPVFERPTRRATTATKVAFELYKEAKEEYGKYNAGMETFKSYLIDACKTKIMGAMTTPTMPIPMMSVTYIVNQLEATYGIPTTRDVSRLQEDVHKPCRSDGDFLYYVQEMKRNFIYLEEQRAGYSEVQKMQILQAGTTSLTNVKMAITRYVVAHPKLAERTYDTMVAYITEELPNFMEADQLSTASAITTAVTKTETATTPITKDELAYCFAQLLGQLGAMTVRMPRRGQNTNGRGNMATNGGRGGGSTNTTTTNKQSGAKTRGTTQYCFVHGTNRSHNGQQCRLMALPSGFTDNQRNATAAAWIDGRQGAI